MKKLLMYLILACGVLCSNSVQANLDELEENLQEIIKERSLDFSAKGYSETHFVQYRVASDGSLMHFGIWTDAVIGTIVANANNVGCQRIVWSNGVVFDESSSYSKKGDHFTNKYSWGTITSWDHKQTINTK